MGMSIFLVIICFLMFIFSITIILSNNPILSILSLICSAIGVSLMLFFLGFEFLPYLILMIYVGAVAILFLFITMMINLNLHFNKDLCVGKKVIYLVSFIKMVTFFYALIHNMRYFDTAPYSITWVMNFVSYKQSDILLFGNSLYYYFSIHTILISCLLLVGMVGSIAICLSNKKKIQFF